MSDLIKKIFSVTNVGERKVITILGVKVKIKSRILKMQTQLNYLNKQLKKVDNLGKQIVVHAEKIKKTESMNKKISDQDKKISAQDKKIKELFAIIKELEKSIPRKKTAERILPEHYNSNIYDYLLFLKHKYAYELALKNMKSDYKVLEIGFGDGYGTEIIAKSGANITAVELDADIVEQARQKYNLPNVKFELYDGVTLNYDANSFDMVISYQVIEHVEDVSQYLNNIKQMLKPEGLLLITTPSRTYRLTPEQKPWNKYHLREYNSVTLEADSKSVFPDCGIYSITAREELLNIEFSRVKRYRADYDKTIVENIDLPKDFTNRYSVSDFYVDDKNLDGGLDLLLTNLTINNLLITRSNK